MIFELVQNFHNTTTVERVRRSARFEAGEGEIAGAGETDGVGGEREMEGKASERARSREEKGEKGREREAQAWRGRERERKKGRKKKGESRMHVRG